jgi:hypothetical protein
MSLLNPEEILKLHRVALSFHLEDARDALLEGIDPAVVSELPKGLAPSDQILSDLTELNRIGRLDDGSIPLEIWILNAVSLVPRAAAAAFFEALNALPRELARPPWVFEVEPARDPAPPPRWASKRIPPDAPPPPTAQAGDGPEEPIPSPGKPIYRGEPEALAKASERIVNTGFSAAETPIKTLFGDACLEPGRAYYYWLEVGAPVAGSIEITPVPLPVELLPQDAELTVVLFSNPEGLEVDPNADMGVLRLQPSGDVMVARPASVPPPIASQAEVLATRLFFPVKAPAKEGVYLLRSCIYHRGTLVQSREIRARVARGGRAEARALTSRVDYTLSRTLAPTALRALGEHKLSILLNAGEDGTHGFRFFGEGDYRRSATFDGLEVQSLITSLRGSLRRVSWGSSDAWKPGVPYRFDQEPTFHSLLGDLIDMAKEGARAYDAIARRLGGDAEGEEALREAMRRPGLVQLALKESARFVLPLAMLFDHRLDTWLDPGHYHLCEAFQAATADGAPLEQKPCFLGDCPSRDVDTAICPSGFWGFRHALGVPMTLVNEREGDASPDLQDPLPRGEGPSVTVAVCTDPQMQERDRHVRALLDLFDPARSRVAETRQDAIKALRDITAHIVYFYCHGGTQGDARVPYIQVGPMTDPPIGRDTLRNSKIRWPSPRPLVFINGCHTTDLEPDRAIDLVSGFVETAGASGVIGTEITVFEPLATAFAERFMEAFLRDGHPVGEAVRRARLHLLQKGLNPLGLVYVPFAVASLKLS